MSPNRVALPIIVALALVAGCSDDKTATTTTSAAVATTAATDATDPVETAPPTTLSLADQALAYTDAGPFPVGVTTLELATGEAVEVWYPAAEGTTGTETYDMHDYVPEAIKELLTADIPAGASYTAGRDADVADGAFPVVLFSHGFSGIRLQSTFLTANMASWGLIVVSPEHPSRDLNAVLGGGFAVDEDPAVEDLTQSLDLIIAAGDDAASPFLGHIDGEHVAAVGHSAGGISVVRAAAVDTRIDGYVSLASHAYLPLGAESTPAVPSLFIAGSLDGIVSVEQYTRPSYESALSPSALWVIEGAGHNAFDDFCTFGGGSGIIGIAEASGLGALLDAQPQLRTLGQDGCLPPAVPVDTTFPIIRHAVTAWVLQLFGTDTAPVGLGADVADQYGTPVEITSK